MTVNDKPIILVHPEWKISDTDEIISFSVPTREASLPVSHGIFYCVCVFPPLQWLCVSWVEDILWEQITV